MVIAQFQGSWTPGDIVELLQSPPLRQQLDAFTHVSYSSLPKVPGGSGMLILMFGCVTGSTDWADRSCSIWS